MNWSFPNGIDREGTVFPAYAAEMDQYMVIGRDGRVTYVSPITGFDEGAIDIPALRRAIEGALDGVVPVRKTTWSWIKRLWSP